MALPECFARIVRRGALNTPPGIHTWALHVSGGEVLPFSQVHGHSSVFGFEGHFWSATLPQLAGPRARVNDIDRHVIHPGARFQCHVAAAPPPCQRPPPLGGVAAVGDRCRGVRCYLTVMW